MAASDDSPSRAFTVASLIADARAANLPPPTVQTLMDRLVYPCPTLALYPRWTASREDEFIDASHHASKPSPAFSGVLALPSLGSLLSRTGSGVLSSAVGDAKNRALSDLNDDERAALDKALETFFSPGPGPTNTCSISLVNAVQSLWGIFKTVVRDLPQRTWEKGWCPYPFKQISSGVASSALVKLSDDMNAQPVRNALRILVSDEGCAGVHGYHKLDLATRALFEKFERKLADPVWRRQRSSTSEVVLLLTASRFVPVFILDLADSEPSLRKLVDSFRARRPSLASLEAVSLADSQVVADLASKIPTGPPLKKDYIVIYGSEAPVDCSLKPGQPSLLHILLLAALDQDNLRETIGRELLHLLTPLPEDSSSENLSQSPPTDLPQPLERAEGLVPALEAKSTAQTDSLNNVASAVSSGMSAVSVVSTSVQQTVAPAGYRLVTFDELEKGCAFAAAFVDHAGELVGFHRFPTSKPVKPLSPAKVPSLPPTPPPTPPRAASIEPEGDQVSSTLTPPEPLLLLSGTRFGTGHQGYVYRVHCADAPVPLLAKYSYDREGYDLMKDEAAFYRKNHAKLEEERLAPRFVGSWKTKGEDSPMRYGASSMMLLVEEWGQALDCWRELDDDEAQQHMKELAMRFHLTLGYEHNSLSPRNVVWRREDGPASLRLIDFARSEPHWCDTNYTCCCELSRLGRNLGCGLRLSEVRNFVGQRKTREELGRVAAVQHELEEQARREVELGRTVAAVVVDGPQPERAETVQGGVVTGQKRKASNGRKGRGRDDGAASRPSTPRQRPAKRKA